MTTERYGGNMTQLRRCSPEIERELHDKEARIRELEGRINRADRYLALGSPNGAREALAPPDSEPAERAEKCLVCDGTGNLYGRQPEGVYGYLPCHNCKGTGKPPIRDPAEQQDAMLERREALEALLELGQFAQMAVPGSLEHDRMVSEYEETVRRAIIEPAVPEVVRRLPEKMRADIAHLRKGSYSSLTNSDAIRIAATDHWADELDRAIAEQGK